MTALVDDTFRVLAAFRQDDRARGRALLAGMPDDELAALLQLASRVRQRALTETRRRGDRLAREVVLADALSAVRALPPLRRADHPDPVEFSRLVAAHYRAWASAGERHPVAAIAGHTGVNAATVHTWVREARLRGILEHAR